MNIKRNIFFVCFFIISACSPAPVKTTTGHTPQKVSRDYEAIGDATGIRPYIYGKHTLIKFDAGKPFFMSVKDAQGASVGHTMQGGYYVLDRKLDSFTLTGLRSAVQFNLIHPESPVETTENTIDSQMENEPEALSLSENTETIITSERKIKTSDPIYAIMYKQMQQLRKLLNIASENPTYTGEELFQINARLDSIEYKIANRNAAIVHVYFPFNNTLFKPDSELVNALLPIAKDAIRINVYGRTDAKVPDDGNRQVAEGRVVATKDFLVNHGVPESIIHSYPRASGDFIAPEAVEEGRKLNRRVTIEVITQ